MQYAVAAQARLHGYDPKDALVLLRPQPGASVVTTDDVRSALAEHGSALSLALLPGVQYLDGALMDIRTLTQLVRAAGAVAGFDLAHAAGNVPLSLHDWGVDFACWCTYKYLNSGPGALGGVFVHERHFDNPDLVRLAGWWGHEKPSRFAMPREFNAAEGAAGFAASNPPVWPLLSMRASLDLFAAAGMQRLRAKSLLLTAYMELLLTDDPVLSARVRILTPRDPQQRGAMLCVELAGGSRPVHDALGRLGVVCDFREPNVVRASAAPLYNSFNDVRLFAERLRTALDSVAPVGAADGAAAGAKL